MRRWLSASSNSSARQVLASGRLLAWRCRTDRPEVGRDAPAASGIVSGSEGDCFNAGVITVYGVFARGPRPFPFHAENASWNRTNRRMERRVLGVKRAATL
jgi:hypothetical protein